MEGYIPFYLSVFWSAREVARIYLFLLHIVLIYDIIEYNAELGVVKQRNIQ